MKMRLTIGTHKLTATLADNSSVRALTAKLAEGPVTLDLEDYAHMEKVGPLGFALPTNDESTTTGPGDLILYLGTQFVIYYDRNSWSFTRLGHIDGVGADELRRILGRRGVRVTLALVDDGEGAVA